MHDDIVDRSSTYYVGEHANTLLGAWHDLQDRLPEGADPYGMLRAFLDKHARLLRSPEINTRRAELRHNCGAGAADIDQLVKDISNLVLAADVWRRGFLVVNARLSEALRLG